MTDRLRELSPSWRARVDRAVACLRERGVGGRVGLVLGSGLGDFADQLAEARICPYADVPGFSRTSVAAHRGRLVAGTAAGVPVVALQGRLHAYEGLPAEETLLPAATLACLGIGVALVTNAAGGLNPHYRPGDLMVIQDHLDLHLQDPLRGLVARPAGAGDGAAGSSGPVPPGGRGGAVRPLYDGDLSRELLAAGAAAGLVLRSGIYASLWGPAYETRAEIGFLRRAGCDAVGMSTAPETALLARLGVRVAGLSCITNPSHEVGELELSHEDVIETGRLAADRLTRLVLAFLPRAIAAART